MLIFLYIQTSDAGENNLFAAFDTIGHSILSHRQYSSIKYLMESGKERRFRTFFLIVIDYIFLFVFFSIYNCFLCICFMFQWREIKIFD